MANVVDELSQVASNPVIDIPANVAELLTPAKPAEPAISADDRGSVPESKDDEFEVYNFKQDYNNVKKPDDSSVFNVSKNNITFNAKTYTYDYPRKRADFIQYVTKGNTYALLNALGINAKPEGMPRNKLLTVQAMYDHFLSSNPNLMTTTKPAKYWFQ